LATPHLDFYLTLINTNIVIHCSSISSQLVKKKFDLVVSILTRVDLEFKSIY